MGNKQGKKKGKKKKSKDPDDASSEEADDGVIFSKTGGKVCVDDYDLLKVIGKGSFGKVMLVRHKASEKVYAMKILKKSMLLERDQVEHTRAERDIMSSVAHPFIVTLVAAFQTPEKLYMVLEYVNGGELFFHLRNSGRFSEARVKLYAAELSSVLMFVHSKGIVYRDLKPENILLDSEGHIMVTDFGLSKKIAPADEPDAEGGQTSTFCGTPEYLAPEILQGKPYDHAVDYWSLGTLIFELIVGLPPFFSANVNEMYRRIISDPLEFPEGIMSEEAKSLITGFLDRDPASRLGSGPTGADDIKSHPFFADLDWDKVLARGYKPEFCPDVSGEADVSQVDPTFTSEQVVDTPVEDNALADGGANPFEGFTFAEDSALQQ